MNIYQVGLPEWATSVHTKYIAGVVLVLVGLFTYHHFAMEHALAKADKLEAQAAEIKKQAQASAQAAQVADIRIEQEKQTSALAEKQVAIASAKVAMLRKQVADAKAQAPKLDAATHDQLVAIVDKQDEEIQALNTQHDADVALHVADVKVINDLTFSRDHWKDAYDKQVRVDELKDKAMAEVRSAMDHQKWKFRIEVGGAAAAGYGLGRLLRR